MHCSCDTALKPKLLHMPTRVDTIQYDLSTGYTQVQTVQRLAYDGRCSSGAPRVSASVVLIVRTLSHQLRMPHFLELVVKVTLSVTLDYSFQK